ncbi:MAG: hypothetical protein JWN75_393 [Candidatus Saccharibacteria bacterium]|nr:hypothetical protein [Candidatus Saccharibacteria bacterium]
MTKILLVEDDKSLREIYGVRLLAEGYDIVSAGDGEEALAMAIKEKPTLIISDVMMPKISGFDMLDILRSTTETRDIKVIMMTALSSDDQRTRGEQLGADRYLVKSQVGIEDVVRTVHEVLGDAAGAASAAATPATPAVDEPSVPSVPAALPVEEPAPVVPEPVTPVADSAAVPDAAPVAEPVVEPVVAAEPVDESTPGPLPPQPSENVSVLPQPTAPFSSPRPTNLGERVIHPIEDQEEPSTLTPEIGDQIAKELQASAEPVANSQVDEAISDTDVEPAVPTITPNFEPAAPELPDLSVPVVPETPPTSEFPPITPPAADDKPPTITGTSSPVS